ncbi:unnamed protein product, partial [Mesorhabditis belari]|uniref:Uncharacterized protein n=1 Tax=Mesorhabditis belari TaxID=2138241 RepID=A0AAF3EHH9_9BILA
MIVLDGDAARIVGEKFSARIEKFESVLAGTNFIDRLLHQCPRVQKILIQSSLFPDDVQAISRISASIHHLSIANLNYKVTPDGCRFPSFKCAFPLLRSLSIVPRLEAINRPSTQLTLEGIEKLFTPTLVKLRLDGIALRNEILEKIFTLTSLQELHLGGCLVDSLTAQKHVHFDRLPQLVHLSLPASLFTLYRPLNGAQFEIPFSLKSLTRLETLIMHCEMLHEESFMKCLHNFFPPNLKTLYLVGHTISEPKTRVWQTLKLRFKIERIRSDTAIVKNGLYMNQMPKKRKLISDSFWCDPYRPVNRIIARNNPQSIMAPESWQVSVPEVTGALNTTVIPIVRPVFHPPPPRSPAVHTARSTISDPNQIDNLDEFPGLAGLLVFNNDPEVDGEEAQQEQEQIAHPTVSTQAVAGTPPERNVTPQEMALVDQMLMGLLGLDLLRIAPPPPLAEAPANSPVAQTLQENQRLSTNASTSTTTSTSGGTTTIPSSLSTSLEVPAPVSSAAHPSMGPADLSSRGAQPPPTASSSSTTASTSTASSSSSTPRTL